MFSLVTIIIINRLNFSHKVYQIDSLAPGNLNEILDM